MSPNVALLKKVFLEAVEKIPGPERKRYVEEMCATDPELKRSLEALLSLHDKLSGVKQVNEPTRPANGAPNADTAFSLADEAIREQVVTGGELQPEDVINGKYKIIEKLGEGGMGTIYLAQQLAPLRRKVAVKIIKWGLDSAAVLQRFEAERQALALMDHPHIARVFDGGVTDRGRPYFVMEYVKGIPLTKYCDDNRLTVTERLLLFVQICRAVQHAHQKGVIHRDLKPSNLLVALYDGVPMVKVIDFGLAKALHQPLTESSLFTPHGVAVGTPAYMSPEQAEFNNLDIDTRADVYSLGVVLYELLTASTPHDKHRFKDAPWIEVLRILREEEPPKPSTRLGSSNDLPAVAAHRRLEPVKLDRMLRGELDWIVMRALEKERGRRYQTAQEMLLDVERYLNDEPVSAGPPSTRYRIQKYLRRHKSQVAAGLLILVALTVGFAATWVALVRAWNAESLARSENEEKTEVIYFLDKDLIAKLDPMEQLLSQRIVDKDVKLRTLLDQAADVVANRFAKAPLVEATIRQSIGKGYLALGEYDKALRHLTRAGELRTENLGTQSPSRIEALLAQGHALLFLTKYQEAERIFQEVHQFHLRQSGRDQAITWESLFELARSRADQPDKRVLAEEEYVSAAENLTRILSKDHRTTLRVQHALAQLYLDQESFPKAEQLLTATFEAQKRVLHPQHLDVQDTMNTLGLLHRKMGNLAKAEETYKALIEISEKTLPSDHPDHLVNLNNLAAVYIHQKLPKSRQDAKRILTEIIPKFEQKLSRNHELTIAAISNLASVHYYEKEFDRAIELLQDAHNRSIEAYGKDNENTKRLERFITRAETDRSRVR